MLIEAFNYKQWADQRTLDAITSIDGNKYPAAATFARQQLNHMVRVEELFRARLLSAAAPHRSTNTEVVPEFPELKQRIGDSNQWFARYVQNLAPAHRSQPVTFQFVDGKPGTMTRLEILFHIINHSTYHRGAIGHSLDLAQVPHPADTYTVFIHAAEPKRRGKT
ncbi:MAG: DinB family protein [Pseudomonadota bacterium]